MFLEFPPEVSSLFLAQIFMNLLPSLGHGEYFHHEIHLEGMVSVFYMSGYF